MPLFGGVQGQAVWGFERGVPVYGRDLELDDLKGLLQFRLFCDCMMKLNPI